MSNTCDDAIVGPAVNNGYYATRSTSAPQGGASLTQTLTYDWVWTPTGTLAADPPPYKDVKIDYTIAGGPIKALINGNARTAVTVDMYADYSTKSGSWYKSLDTAATNASVTEAAPGNLSVVIPSMTARYSGTLQIINGDTLHFKNDPSAATTSFVAAYHGADAQSVFNNVSIQTTTLSIQ